MKDYLTYTETLLPALYQSTNRLVSFLEEHASSDDGWNVRRAENLKEDMLEIAGGKFKDYTYCEVKAAGTNVTLTVRFEHEGRRHLSYKDAAKTDKDGNEWCGYSFRIDINWPSHGSCDAATALARLAFYQKCALFAAELQSQFASTYMHLERTKAEIDEQARVAAERQLKEKVRSIVDANCKGLKVAGSRSIGSVQDQLPEGLYHCTLGRPTEPRIYKLNVQPGCIGLLTRVS